jgi:hypothetical protein
MTEIESTTRTIGAISPILPSLNEYKLSKSRLIVRTSPCGVNQGVNAPITARRAATGISHATGGAGSVATVPGGCGGRNPCGWPS